MADYDYEPTPHPYTSFNKQPHDAPTLVGNWQEERSLKEVTGITRYEPWTEKGARDRSEDLQNSVYTTRQDHAKQAQTFTRTVEHTQQTHPGNWASVTQISYQDPVTKPKLMEYKAVAPGPRERKLMEAMMAEAKQLPADLEYSLTERSLDPNGTARDLPAPYRHHNVPPTLDSSYRAHFDEKDMTGLMIGTRVIKDADMRPAVRDPTFLAETQIMPKADCDRILNQQAQASGATQTILMPDPNIPITIYSEAVAKGTYGEGSFSGTRTMSKVSPFNKYSNFSKPMSEYNKVVVDE